MSGVAVLPVGYPTCKSAQSFGLRSVQVLSVTGSSCGKAARALGQLVVFLYFVLSST